MYCLTVVGTKSPQRVSRVGSFWGLWGSVCSMPLYLTCRWGLLPVSSHPLPFCMCVSVSKFPLLMRTPVTWIRIHPDNLILTWLPLKRPYLWGTSLVVQWLRICPPRQGMQIWSLIPEPRSHMSPTIEHMCSGAPKPPLEKSLFTATKIPCAAAKTRCSQK